MAAGGRGGGGDSEAGGQGPGAGLGSGDQQEEVRGQETGGTLELETKIEVSQSWRRSLLGTRGLVSIVS